MDDWEKPLLQATVTVSNASLVGKCLRTGIRLLIFILLFGMYHRPAYCFLPTVGQAPQKAMDQFFPEGREVEVSIWIENLEIPWSLVFLPDGRALVSERPGSIRMIKGGKLQEIPFSFLEVAAVGEGGLMGLARHPEFPIQPYIYAMHTYRKDGDLYNRVVRLKAQGDQGVLDKVIIDHIPGGRFHNGGRIAFGPDGLLYITAGETFQSGLAQDLRSLGGKILRVTPEGGIPPDNPFHRSPIYSYGHRNPQGIAWHPETADLFAAEHGPSGEFLLFANDEVNVITKGANYGWPEVVGAPGLKPYVDPVLVWKKTTPPSGMAFHSGKLLTHLKHDLFIATLRSQALIRIKLKKEKGVNQVTNIERWFSKDYGEGNYGRLRDVIESPDGSMYLLTNNRDGRGKPRPGDDKIYRILPKR